MELKKNPAKDIHRQRGMFFLVGLSIGTSLIITAFEWRSPKPELPRHRPDDGMDEVIYEPPVISEAEPAKEVDRSKRIKPVSFSQVIEEVKDILETVETPPLQSASTESFEIHIEEPLPEPVEAPPFDIVEQMPMPVGGYDNFYHQIAKSIRYPGQAERAGVEGKVFVQFIVQRDGMLTDLNVVKGIGFGCDEEAKKAIAKTSWYAGKQRGREVKVRMIIPIHFKLP